MKKSVITYAVIAALMLSLAACGSAPAGQPQITAEPPAQPAEQPETAVPSDSASIPARQDGERFDAVIILEGMEETVHYEHIRNDALGIEMDYDYESFVRQSGAGQERFLSVWDDPNAPENYLELRYDAGSAELVASAVNAALSEEYETIVEERTLDNAGVCLHIDASEVKGGGYMPEQLQAVYIIPAADGCRVATAHYSIESAEGFGRRFSYMINTLAVIERNADNTLSDELALSAVRNYCFASNPDLADIASGGEYPVYWELVSSDAQQIVVLFRSYTGAQLRYYIDRSTGEAYVTEFVPGVTPEEARTDESLNVWDYMD